MTCDHCKAPILPTEVYSVTAEGRLHAACLRLVAPRGLMRGPIVDGERCAPIVAWHAGR